MKVARETCERQKRCTKEMCPEDCADWKDNHLRIKEETRLLPVVLTQDELLAAGDALSDALERANLLELELKTVKEQYKGRTAEIEGTIAKLSALVRAKVEPRDVTVAVVFNYGNGTVVTSRSDTGKVLEDRDMTRDESQRHLEFGEKWEKEQQRLEAEREAAVDRKKEATEE